MYFIDLHFMVHCYLFFVNLNLFSACEATPTHQSSFFFYSHKTITKYMQIKNMNIHMWIWIIATMEQVNI